MTPVVRVLPGILAEELIEELKLEFPRFTGSSYGEERVREQGRAFRLLADQMASPDFVAQVSECVGVDALEPDLDFHGAGLRAAREGALPGWWNGRHKRGWWPRVGVVVNLTPEWKDPWTEGAGLALLVCDGNLPEAVTVTGPTEPTGPCLSLLATLYTRDPPHLDQLPALPESEHRDVIVALPDSFGTNPEAFETDLSALRTIVEANGTALARATEREALLAARFMALVERPFWDGTGPFSAAELTLVRRVLDARTGLLRRHAEIETEYLAATQEVPSSPHPPIEGPALVERIDGYWRDRWVTSSFELILRPVAEIERVRIRGYISPEVTERLRLTARIGEEQHRLLAPTGPLAWELPVRAAIGERVVLRIKASHQWIPSNDGISPDPRPLSWVLTAVDVE